MMSCRTVSIICERAVRRVVALHVGRGHVDREELRAHAAFLHAREVGVMVGIRLTDIQPCDGGAGDVVVGVDQDGGLVHTHDFGVGNCALLPSGSLREDRGGRCGQCQGGANGSGHCGEDSMAGRIGFPNPY